MTVLTRPETRRTHSSPRPTAPGRRGTLQTSCLALWLCFCAIQRTVWTVHRPSMQVRESAKTKAGSRRTPVEGPRGQAGVCSEGRPSCGSQWCRARGPRGRSCRALMLGFSRAALRQPWSLRVHVSFEGSPGWTRPPSPALRPHASPVHPVTSTATPPPAQAQNQEHLPPTPTGPSLPFGPTSQATVSPLSGSLPSRLTLSS